MNPNDRPPVPNYQINLIDLSSTGENPIGSATGQLTLRNRANWFVMVDARQPGGAQWPQAQIFVCPKQTNDDLIPIGINGQIMGECEEYRITWAVVASGYTVTLQTSRNGTNENGIRVFAPSFTQVIVAGGGTSLVAGAPISVGAAAVQLVPSSATRQQALIKNTDSNATLFIGPIGVTAATGYPIFPGEEIDVSGTIAAIYGVTAAATIAVAVLVEQ